MQISGGLSAGISVLHAIMNASEGTQMWRRQIQWNIDDDIFLRAILHAHTITYLSLLSKVGSCQSSLMNMRDTCVFKDCSLLHSCFTSLDLKL